MSKALKLLILYLGVSSSAFAAIPEKCGDGIDNPGSTGGSTNGTKGSCPAGYHDAYIGSGCDADCTLDKDGDGYAYTDCDDTHRDIQPGLFLV